MTGKSDDPARSGNVSPPPTLGAISAVVAQVGMSTVDPVLATGTFCPVPRETRDRILSLREGPGPKFRETRRVRRKVELCCGCDYRGGWPREAAKGLGAFNPIAARRLCR